jgi:predicted dehydrogenase
MNILIIGMGSIARKHIVTIRKYRPEANIYAFRSSAVIESYLEVKNIYNIDSSLKFDFVIISNPTWAHEKSILDSIELGCPMFIEKPVLSNLSNFAQIIKSISQNNIATYIACNLRFHPVIKYLKKYLQENEVVINEVNIYCGSYLPSWRPGRDYKTVYSSIPELGGGVHLDLIHELDYCIWLFGYPENTLVSMSNVSSLGIDSIDYAHYMMKYKKFMVAITLNYFRRDSKRYIELVFDNTTWNVDLLKCTITSSDNDVVFSEEFNIFQTYFDQMQYFINSIETKQKMMNDIEESIQILKICLTNEQA